MLLLDTNITSYMLEGASEYARFRPLLDGQELAISVFTITEHWYGANLGGRKARRRQRLEEFLEQFPLLEATREVAYDCAWLLHRMRQIGRPAGIAGDFDVWIAATARTYKLPLVTHNVKHFKSIPGLTLVHPTTDEPPSA